MKFLSKTKCRRLFSQTFLLAIALTSATTNFADRCLPCFAQTVESVESVVNSSKILPSEYKVRAYVRGPEATIVTYRNAKAVDQDCKIDAILLAQKVMAAFKPIAAVRTQFCSIADPKQYDQVEVHAGDVKAFGAGGMTKQRLLDSLPITKAGPGISGGMDKLTFQIKLRDYQPIPGYAYEVRKQILTQLRAIEHNNGDAREYWPAFIAIENKVKLGFKEELVNECNLLTDRVAHVNETVKQNFALNEQRRTAEHDRLVTKAASETFEPHTGPMYANRMRLAAVIKTRMAAGQDMKRPIDYLVNTIEVYARQNDIPHLQAAIAGLEQQLNLTPLR